MNRRTYTGTSIARYDITSLDQLTAGWSAGNLTVRDLPMAFKVLSEAMEDIESMKDDRSIISNIESNPKLKEELSVRGYSGEGILTSMKKGFDIYRSNILTRVTMLLIKLNTVPTESNREVVMYIDALKRVNASVPEGAL